MSTPKKCWLRLFLCLLFLSSSCLSPGIPIVPTPSASTLGLLRIAFLSNREGENGQVYTVALDGSGLAKLADLPAGEKTGWAFSPDGRWLAFNMVSGTALDIYLMDLHDLTLINLCRKPLFPNPSPPPSWSPNGQLLAFASSRGWDSFIHIFSLNSTEIISFTLPKLVLFSPPLAWSPDGNHIAFAAYAYRGQDISDGELGDADIYVVSLDGSTLEQLTDTPGADDMPAWTPDGRILFRSFRDGNSEIYIMNSDGTNQVNLTNQPSNESSPFPSPDGHRIAFLSDRSDRSDLFVMSSTGTEQVNISRSPGSIEIAASWSPDGKWLAVTSVEPNGNWEIYVVDSQGEHRCPLAPHPARDGYPTWMPSLEP